MLDPPYPAALEFEIEYPRQNAEIVGVELDRNYRSGAIVLWEPDPGGEATCQAPGAGTLKIHMVDTEELTGQLRIIYRVLNFDDTCGKRLDASDFLVKGGSVKAYDPDGDEITDYNDVLVTSASG